jgi:hypothetical protein
VIDVLDAEAKRRIGVVHSPIATRHWSRRTVAPSALKDGLSEDEILAHADELSAKFENYEPIPALLHQHSRTLWNRSCRRARPWSTPARRPARRWTGRLAPS